MSATPSTMAAGGGAGSTDGGWRGSLYELTQDGSRGAAVRDAQARIERTGQGVEFDIETTGLTPGNGYTVWLMAFNNPSACQGVGAPAGFRCGPDDMGNPDAGFGLLFSGAGGFANSETMSFRGQRVLGDADGVELGTAGLREAGAEIHVRVRDHGPVQPGLEHDQIGTLMGGCTDTSAPGAGSGGHGSYECRDVQATGI